MHILGDMSALLQQQQHQQQQSCSPSSALLAQLRHHLHTEIVPNTNNNSGVISHQHPNPNDVLLTLLARNKNLEGKKLLKIYNL